MKKQIILSLLLLVGCFPQIGFASKAELVNEALEASKISDVFKKLPGLFQGGGSSLTLGQVDESKKGEMSQALMKSFDPDKLWKGFLSEFSKNIDEASLKDVIVFQKSDVAKKVKAQPGPADINHAGDEIKKYEQELSKNPPSKERDELVTQIIDETGSTEIQASLMKAMINALSQGFSGVSQAKEKRPSQEEQNMLTQMIAQGMKEEQKKAMLYAFRTLSDSELKEYAKFLTSKSGKNFTRATVAGIETVMTQAASQFGKTMGSQSKKTPTSKR